MQAQVAPRRRAEPVPRSCESVASIPCEGEGRSSGQRVCVDRGGRGAGRRGRGAGRLRGGGSDGGGATEPGKLAVATTVAPITSIVANIGGDRVDAHRHRPRGDELAHVRAEAERRGAARARRPRVRERARARGADGRARRARTSRTAPRSSQLGDQLHRREATGSTTSRSRSRAASRTRTCGPNPKYALCYARVARDTLSARDPGQRRATTRRNYDAFAGDGRRASTRRCARRSRRSRSAQLLTYHDAYAYFAQDYGWKVIGAIQVSDFEDPTRARGRRR